MAMVERKPGNTPGTIYGPQFVPTLDDNSLQTVSSDSLPQLTVDDNFVQTPVENNHVHILPHDESFGDYSFGFQKKDIKSNVHPWKNMPEELQAVLPSQSQYTYVIDNFQTLQREDYSGAPKFAFKF